MNKINVCVFPAQSESAVEINNALANCEGIEVFGVTSVRGHNEYNFKNYYYDMVDIDDERFCENFEKFIIDNHIDIVFPTNDSTVVFFAQNKNKFSAKIVNCDEKSALICNDKFETYNLFIDCAFCPQIYKSFSNFPCFIKPKNGEGSRGIKLINTVDDIPNNINIIEYIIMEYLPGKEITVDCLTDCKGELRIILPRTRDKIFSGMSVYGTTFIATEEIKSIAEKINERLKFKGLWYFQIKQDIHGNYKLLEISMRCAGTMCQSRARGFNLPLLSVYTTLNQNIEVIDNGYNVTIDRTLFARYKTNISYNTVYVDYDGTIIVKGKVCLSIIRFLFQCKNEGKQIVLITRHNEDHENNVIDDMTSYGISSSLFDDIICLSFDEEKYTVIRNLNSIFIDNSFIERKKVFINKKIPVFSVDGIDLLQDWRI